MGIKKIKYYLHVNYNTKQDLKQNKINEPE